jgi:CBS-domain-containing membrane protein
MSAMPRFISPNSLILVAIGVSLAAAAVLFTIPASPLIWQVATWTLVAGLAGLLMLVLVSGYVLARDRASRTWGRIATFLFGLACLVVVALASF